MKKNKDDLIFFDLETTGLYPGFNKVLTAAFVRVSRKKLKIKDTLSLKIRHEEYNASEMALAKNGINLETHHKEGISLDEATEQIRDFIYHSGMVLGGHNIVGFDIKFMANLFENFEDRVSGDFIDTLVLARKLRKAKLLDVPDLRLETLTKALGIKHEQAHEALSDTLASLQLYSALREYL